MLHIISFSHLHFFVQTALQLAHHGGHGVIIYMSHQRGPIRACPDEERGFEGGEGEECLLR